jgi:L-iduronidase
MSTHVFNLAGPFKPLQHFWRATGFTPARRLLDKDMQLNLTILGAVPRRGIEHVRIHHLLALINLESLNAAPDFSDFDKAFDVLIHNRLKPFFELMGNPSDRFSDFNDPIQLAAWASLIESTVRHCVSRYGLEEVSSWYFETWNEPDCPTWWKQFDDDPAALCRYYDACREGLDRVDRTFRLGGPGGQSNLNKTTRAFFDHVARNGRIDFFSFHEKGGTWTPEDILPDSVGLLRRERIMIDHLRSIGLGHVPVMNNEADPQIGWGTPHSWHAKAFYAAWSAQMIISHLSEFVDQDVLYDLLVFDNGFVGTWGQRTLLCRLGRKEDVDAGRFELIPKPIFHLMSLLTLLGESRSTIETSDDGRLKILPTRCADGCVAIMIVSGDDDIHADGTRRITIDLREVGIRHGTLACWQIGDGGAGDAFAVWEQFAAWADNHTPEQIAMLHRSAGLIEAHAPRPIATRDGRLKISLNLGHPGVAMLLIAPADLPPPPPIASVEVRRFESLRGPANLLSWKPAASRNVRRYEVERSIDGSRWVRLPSINSLAGFAFDFAPIQGATYRIVTITLDDIQIV